MDVLYTQFSTLMYKVLKRGENMLDNRKKKVLQAIVEEYIETAEPVSSKALIFLLFPDISYSPLSSVPIPHAGIWQTPI